MALKIQLEAFAGDGIAETCRGMCAAADRLGLWVELNFNDVKLLCSPGANPTDLIAGYDAQIAKKTGTPRFAAATGHK